MPLKWSLALGAFWLTFELPAGGVPEKSRVMILSLMDESGDWLLTRFLTLTEWGYAGSHQCGHIYMKRHW